MALSAKHLKDLHLPDKAIDVIDEAGAAQKLLPAERRAATIGPGGDRGRGREDGARAGAVGVERRQAGAGLARRRAAPGDLRPGRRHRRGGVGDQAGALGAARARQADRQLPVRRADRRRQDRAGAAARAHPRRRVPALRHVGVHGEARRVAPHRRAARLRRLRGGRPAHRRGPQVAARGAAARRDREGAPGHVQHPAAGHGPRHADRLARPQGRLPPRHPDHDHQRRRARRVGPPARVRRDRAWAARRAARSSARSRRSSATGSTRSSPSTRSGTAEVEKVVDKQIDELRGDGGGEGHHHRARSGGARLAGGQGLRPRVRRAADGAARSSA